MRFPEDVLKAVLESPYTRYPVYRESLDDIVGVLHIRDLIEAMHDAGLAAVDLETLVRPAYMVPETKDLGALLSEFRRTNQHLAVVIDEYGSMEGIVTLEDLLEEIVGEIEDEFDLPDETVERIDETRFGSAARSRSRSSTRNQLRPAARGLPHGGGLCPASWVAAPDRRRVSHDGEVPRRLRRRAAHRPADDNVPALAQPRADAGTRGRRMTKQLDQLRTSSPGARGSDERLSQQVRTRSPSRTPTSRLSRPAVRGEVFEQTVATTVSRVCAASTPRSGCSGEARSSTTIHAPDEAAVLAMIRERSGARPRSSRQDAALPAGLFGRPFRGNSTASRGPSEWSAGERELFAGFTSLLHQCPF
jgi:CBS domain-containing protein